MLGIVGAEGAKFSPEGEARARAAIRWHLDVRRPGLVVSGACHLGGVDVWAIEEAERAGYPTREFPPATRQWSTGFKPRNIQIARVSGCVLNIVVARYWPGYTGMRFPRCYHCHSDDHVKSGGCWTLRHALTLGKQGIRETVEP